MWTKKQPEAGGCYWYRDTDGELTIAQPVFFRGEYLSGFMFLGTDEVVLPELVQGEFWSEPIKEPQD